MAKTCTPNNPCFTPVSMWGRMLIYPPITGTVFADLVWELIDTNWEAIDQTWN